MSDHITRNENSSVQKTEASTPQKHHSPLLRLMAMIDAKFFNTPMLTTLITALIAPVVIIQVNNYIQNKSIQQNVITTVLQHTNAEDFSKVHSLEKIQVIASFVNENKDIFQLQFDSTLKRIQMLKQTGYVSLSTELERNKLDIEVRNKRIMEDSIAIKKADVDIQELQRQKSALVLEQRNQQGQSRRQRDALSAKIAEKESEIGTRTTELQTLTSNFEANKKELEQLKENNVGLAKNLEKAQQSLDKLLSEKDQLNAQLNENKKLLAMEAQGQTKLQEALQKTNDEWKKALKDNEVLISELNKLKFENSNISKDLAAAQAKAALLQTQVDALQKVNPTTAKTSQTSTSGVAGL